MNLQAEESVVNQKGTKMAERVTQWLRAYTALAEDLLSMHPCQGVHKDL